MNVPEIIEEYCKDCGNYKGGSCYHPDGLCKTVDSEICKYLDGQPRNVPITQSDIERLNLIFAPEGTKN